MPGKKDQNSKTQSKAGRGVSFTVKTYAIDAMMHSPKSITAHLNSSLTARRHELRSAPIPHLMSFRLGPGFELDLGDLAGLVAPPSAVSAPGVASPSGAGGWSSGGASPVSEAAPATPAASFFFFLDVLGVEEVQVVWHFLF